MGQSSVDGTAVILTWTLPGPSSDDNATVIGVIIYRNESTVMTEWVRVIYIGSRFTSTTITGLNPAKAYRFCISAVNQYGEGSKSNPTNYLPAGRGQDSEVETKEEFLTNFQIFGIIVGGLAFVGAIVLCGYIFLYRSQHKDEINTYQPMPEQTHTSPSSTWGGGGSHWNRDDGKKATGMALDDGTTLVASGGPVYGFENPPSTSGKNKKKSKKEENDIDSDQEDPQKKKKKKSKRKSKSRKKRG